MKFIHLSNVNLGAEPIRSDHLTVNRAEDAANDFYSVLRTCQEDDIDALFITGTLFVKPPTEEELRDLDDRFLRLSDTRVFYAPGVFPGGGDNSVYTNYEWRSNTHVFSGESIQRIHVSRFSVEVTGVGYSARSWHKVKPSGLVRGRKGAIQVLLLPFSGEAADSGSPEELKALPFDYIGAGQTHSYLSENGNRVYAPGSFTSAGFDDTDRHGYIVGNLEDDGRKRAALSCQFISGRCKEYLEIRVNAHNEILYQEVEDQVRAAMEDYGMDNVYRIRISGDSSPSLYIMKDSLYQLGNVLEIVDETDTDAVKKLLTGGRDEKAITRFVDAVLSEEDVSVKQKAIQYGIDALLSEE